MSRADPFLTPSAFSDRSTLFETLDGAATSRGIPDAAIPHVRRAHRNGHDTYVATSLEYETADRYGRLGARLKDGWNRDAPSRPCRHLSDAGRAPRSGCLRSAWRASLARRLIRRGQCEPQSRQALL